MEVFVPDEHMASLRPHLLLGGGGVRVQVRASDLARATELLDSFERAVGRRAHKILRRPAVLSNDDGAAIPRVDRYRLHGLLVSGELF